MEHMTLFELFEKKKITLNKASVEMGISEKQLKNLNSSDGIKKTTVRTFRNLMILLNRESMDKLYIQLTDESPIQFTASTSKNEPLVNLGGAIKKRGYSPTSFAKEIGYDPTLMRRLAKIGENPDSTDSKNTNTIITKEDEDIINKLRLNTFIKIANQLGLNLDLTYKLMTKGIRYKVINHNNTNHKPNNSTRVEITPSYEESLKKYSTTRSTTEIILDDIKDNNILDKISEIFISENDDENDLIKKMNSERKIIDKFTERAASNNKVKKEYVKEIILKYTPCYNLLISNGFTKENIVEIFDMKAEYLYRIILLFTPYILKPFYRGKTYQEIMNEFSTVHDNSNISNSEAPYNNIISEDEFRRTIRNLHFRLISDFANKKPYNKSKNKSSNLINNTTETIKKRQESIDKELEEFNKLLNLTKEEEEFLDSIPYPETVNRIHKPEKYIEEIARDYNLTVKDVLFFEEKLISPIVKKYMNGDNPYLIEMSYSFDTPPNFADDIKLIINKYKDFQFK